MLGYVCKYTPVEALEAMGADIVRVEPHVSDFNQADALMHPNMCSYAKAVLEDMTQNNYEGLVLTTCCDSIRRLYDTLKNTYRDKFFFLLDVPRKVNDFSSKLYAERIREMMKAYRDFSGKEFDMDRFRQIIHIKHEEANLPEKPVQPDRVRIGLIGARCNPGITKLLNREDVELIFDLTCVGQKRDFEPGNGRGTFKQASGKDQTEDEVFESYAKKLLEQLPCMRMVDAVNRKRYVEGFSNSLDGIVCHTVKFCDTYSYEYVKLHEEADIPVLKIETDTTPQCEGQIRTRLEAFMESLQRIKKEKSPKAVKAAEKLKEAGSMLVMGIDSGSTSTNAVIMNEKKEMVAFDVVRTGAKTADSANKIFEEILARAGIKKEDIGYIVSTGYGRVSIPFADENVTEISCHAKGARYFNPGVKTILDIGGQDSKAIKLGDDGDVVDFVMNDKCAAGTGRFLEAMARTLEMDISKLGPESLKSKETVEISSMCTVFAESEVISLIAQNKEKADIASGVHRAIAGKACSLLSRVNPEPEFMMTGGVAKNVGVVKAVEEKLGNRLYICEEPEIVGAAGAAIFGMERIEKQ